MFKKICAVIGRERIMRRKADNCLLLAYIHECVNLIRTAL